MNNQPAFPTWQSKEAIQGMTLRDYFAAAALTGLLANEGLSGQYADYAKNAYKVADAMLEKRDKNYVDQVKLHLKEKENKK